MGFFESALLWVGRGLPEAIACKRASRSANAALLGPKAGLDETGILPGRARPFDWVSTPASLSRRDDEDEPDEVGAGGSMGRRCSSIRERGAFFTREARVLRCFVGMARALFLRWGANIDFLGGLEPAEPKPDTREELPKVKLEDESELLLLPLDLLEGGGIPPILRSLEA